MTTLTPRYGWSMPDPGGSPNTWGDTLNGTTGKVDEQVYQNGLAGVPIGGIVMFGGATAPTNYLICDGTVYPNANIPKLWPVLNNAYNAGTSAVAGTSSAVPNLNSKFALGVGPANPVGQTGGTFTYNINASQLPAHSHPIVDVGHAHGVNQWTHQHVIATGTHWHNIHVNPHQHTLPGGFGYGIGGTGPSPLVPSGYGTQAVTSTAGDFSGSTEVAGNLGGNSDNLTSNISIQASGTNLSTTGNNTGGGAPIGIVPPYVALNFIIRFQ